MAFPPKADQPRTENHHRLYKYPPPTSSVAFSNGVNPIGYFFVSVFKVLPKKDLDDIIKHLRGFYLLYRELLTFVLLS